MDNQTVAQHLTRRARVLERESGNLYRARAYRRAALVILGLARPVELLVAEEGLKGLRKLPGIGDHLSETIALLVTTGEFCPVTSGRRSA
jgi:DNA polymerase/3'-5' exonuclease PolX